MSLPGLIAKKCDRAQVFRGSCLANLRRGGAFLFGLTRTIVYHSDVIF